MKDILPRLLDKWTGVMFYRLLQRWELENYQLQPKDSYKDFITFHSNRLAGMLVVLYGGSIVGDLYHVSNDIFKRHEVLEGVLNYLVYASREDPIITAKTSRNRERLRAFWMGALVDKFVPDLDDFLSSSLREAYIDSTARAVYFTAACFYLVYDLVASKPNCRALLCPDNDAITGFAEAQFFFSGDILRPLSYLWDQGVNLGRKYRWQDSFENKNAEDFHDAVIQLIKTTTDYIAKTEFMKILEIGAKSELVSILKKATWHDRQDEERKMRAKKRRSREIAFSALASKYGKSLGIDEVLAKERSSLKEVPGMAEEDFRNILQASLNSLTDREKQVLLLKMASTLTNKKVGEKMGISEVRVKQLLDSARQKIFPL